MSEPTTEQVLKPSALSVSDKVSIVNALMAQDRIEIREKQEAVFRLTYYVVPGFIGIAAFFVGNPPFRDILVLAQSLLLLLYVIAFFTFRMWLMQARAYLQIRESFYKNQSLLNSEPFKPIRKIKEIDRETRFEDTALWFPFGITVVCAVVLITYMFLYKA
ncbi:MAG: hypothetical protein FP813_12750 [Desulfurivibrio sp.]|nr:hypothetical protein [Desulfurivibrio sp.]MBU4119777.1 hypothetical protein [Pseudomonadota bacterium]